jgi:hypothetical protein
MEEDDSVKPLINPLRMRKPAFLQQGHKKSFKKQWI